MMTVNTHPEAGITVQHRLRKGGLVDVSQVAESRGRETMVATPTSRLRIMIGETWKREGVMDTRIPGIRDTDLKRIGEVIRGPVLTAARGADHGPVIAGRKA